MSRSAKDAAFDALADLAADVSPADRLMWLVIADRQSDLRGYAWPSATDIAARTGLTVGWVRHSIGRMETAGMIAVDRRPGRVNRYRVLIPNPRAERAGSDPDTRALDARGRAVSARPPRAERARNQLENQLENLPAAPVISTCSEAGCDKPTTGQRWRCDDCQIHRTRRRSL